MRDPLAWYLLRRSIPLLVVFAGVAAYLVLTRAPSMFLGVGFAMGFTLAVVVLMALITIRTSSYGKT